LFDEKPLRGKRRGEELPDSVRKGQRITGVTEKQGALPVVGSCFQFKSYGKSGLRMSELFREMGEFADDMCLVRSMQTDHVLHEAAMSILFTGSMQLGRSSWGSWVSYALGSENKNLPEFVVILSGARDGGSPPAAPTYMAQWLPRRALPGLSLPRRQGTGFLCCQPRGHRCQGAPAHPGRREGSQ